MVVSRLDSNRGLGQSLVTTQWTIHFAVCSLQTEHLGYSRVVISKLPSFSKQNVPWRLLSITIHWTMCKHVLLKVLYYRIQGVLKVNVALEG